MAKQVYRNVSRGRLLTKQEASKYKNLRRRVEAEVPPAKSDPVKAAIAKLRAMREARGISLSELAARTGMTRGNIARLESQKNATLRTLERYAGGLGCKVEIDFVAQNAVKRERTSAIR
jgi:DNA-binding Xre family transcriptional regulator